LGAEKENLKSTKFWGRMRSEGEKEQRGFIKETRRCNRKLIGDNGCME